MARVLPAQTALPRVAIVAILAVVASLSLAGCGRKGPLELPPGTPADPMTRTLETTHLTGPPAKPVASSDDSAEAKLGPVNENPGLIQPPNKSYPTPAPDKLKQAVSTPAPPPINGPPGAPKPGKSFVLDPLL